MGGNERGLPLRAQAQCGYRAAARRPHVPVFRRVIPPDDHGPQTAFSQMGSEIAVDASTDNANIWSERGGPEFHFRARDRL